MSSAAAKDWPQPNSNDRRVQKYRARTRWFTIDRLPLVDHGIGRFHDQIPARSLALFLPQRHNRIHPRGAPRR